MIKAKKSLGQNWLKSEKALESIVAAAKIDGGEQVIEIGPGQGALTELLLRHGAKITAIEKDERLIDFLIERFGGTIDLGNLKLIEGDILQFDSSRLPRKYKLVANIPYYITGEIIRKFLETDHQPELMVLLVQKEVGERIARANKESILSISVKAYGRPRYVQTVPRGAFEPSPKVDSAIIAIENISRGNFSPPAGGVDEKKFFEIVKRGFGSKRKQLKNNLNCDIGILAKCGIEEKARAEDLSLDQWLCLTKHLS